MATCPQHPGADRDTCPECVIRGEQAWESRDDDFGDFDPYDGGEN